MKVNNWLVIGKNGIRRTYKGKNKPSLDWDEIAVRLCLEIPDDLFRRPIIDAKLEVKDVPNNAYNPEIVINTADLIEQQTGAKINFRVVREEKDENN